MNDIFNRNSNDSHTTDDLRVLKETEWLVTNGLGGFATGTLGGALTRVYHGYLVAALPAPFGRTMMLNYMFEHIILPDGQAVPLNGLETEGGKYPEYPECLVNFRLDTGLPVWTYEVGGLLIQKRIVVPHRQNTIYINYSVSGGSGSVKLHLRPAVNMRHHEAPVNNAVDTYTLTVRDHHYELKASNDLPPLRLRLLGREAAFSIDIQTIRDVLYPVERSRGYIARGNLWTPGYFSAEIDPANDVTLVASTENWAVMGTLDPKQASNAENDRKRRLLLEAHPSTCHEIWRELVWAADQFIFTPVGRQEDMARARAAGDEIRSIVAGYHWFTDWGRDTMISLEGLTLVTGRAVEASFILRTFAHYIRDGLIPNMFPEGKTDGLYHTADATLWFFHALNRYIEQTDDRHLLNQLLPQMLDIVGHHLRGTRFHIHVDHKDGLLSQGQAGYQLTWMDAKVDDWVVTPRRGKAVEINALWYNALRLLEKWLREASREKEANGIAEHAAKTKKCFNERFWYSEGGYLYDVVDGEHGRPDSSCRPNQLFAISLEYPVLAESRWNSVLEVVREKLLTPFGLRSLAPGEKDYKPRYDGDLRARDAAYHQGTVWAWLMGPFIDAWLKVHPEDFKTAASFLEGFKAHLREACVGSISEIFDAEPPFTPRGCCAQAWSVAEILRSIVKTGGKGVEKQARPEMATMTVS
jgi:predicted glycogen debranching enzyme